MDVFFATPQILSPPTPPPSSFTLNTTMSVFRASSPPQTPRRSYTQTNHLTRERETLCPASAALPASQIAHHMLVCSPLRLLKGAARVKQLPNSTAAAASSPPPESGCCCPRRPPTNRQPGESCIFLLCLWPLIYAPQQAAGEPMKGSCSLSQHH